MIVVPVFEGQLDEQLGTLSSPVKSHPAINRANGHQPLRRKPIHGQLNRGTLRELAASLKRQWKRYRKGLKRCQDRFSEGAVHESRVETRRLLSLLELLRPFLRHGQFNKGQAALKQHLDTFDNLRDTQVQLLAVDKMRKTFSLAGPFYDYLTNREERYASETRGRIKRIKTRRLAKYIASCREQLKRWRSDFPVEKVNEMLLASVDGAFAKALYLRRNIRAHDAETIHRTRVAFKKVRYMIEILADYLPLADDKLLVAMHRYQTMMGDIQDAEVILRTFDKFLLKKHVDLAAARRFRRELLRRRQWLIRVYLDAADQLLEFWRLEATGDRNGPSATTPDRHTKAVQVARRPGSVVPRPKPEPG